VYTHVYGQLQRKQTWQNITKNVCTCIGRWTQKKSLKQTLQNYVLSCHVCWINMRKFCMFTEIAVMTDVPQTQIIMLNVIWYIYLQLQGRIRRRVLPSGGSVWTASANQPQHSAACRRHPSSHHSHHHHLQKIESKPGRRQQHPDTA